MATEATKAVDKYVETRRQSFVAEYCDVTGYVVVEMLPGMIQNARVTNTARA